VCSCVNFTFAKIGPLHHTFHLATSFAPSMSFPPPPQFSFLMSLPPHEWVLPPCSFVHDVPSSKVSQTPFVMPQIILSHFINKLPSSPFPSKVHERLTRRLFMMELVEEVMVHSCPNLNLPIRRILKTSSYLTIHYPIP
jgi:hypothetical protein